jgi:enamine deaminase RidA (YjgF/YER057c/UK114 family)
MKKNIFLANEREFMAISCEGRPGGTVAEEMRDLYQRVDKELRELGLSLENTVRTRTWTRDKEARNLATDERSKILTGKARASSSSYICPERFESNARVVLDLIAMRPANANLERKAIEYDPPMAYLRYLIYDSFVFVSGTVAHGPNLDHQLTEVLAEIEGSLKDAGSSWDKVTRAAYFLHRSQKVEVLKGLLEKKRRLAVPQTKFCFVDDFAPDAIFIEVEVTARINK